MHQCPRRDADGLITGFAEPAATGTGDLPPGMQVVTKPFAMEVLAARITDLIGTRNG